MIFVLVALAVFRCERIRCDEARVADAFWARGVPIESVARAARLGPMDPVSRVAWWRVDDLLL